MLKKVWGSLLALILESGSSRRRFRRSILTWLLETLGATATRLAMIGLIALYVIWKPEAEPQAESQA